MKRRITKNSIRYAKRLLGGEIQKHVASLADENNIAQEESGSAICFALTLLLSDHLCGKLQLLFFRVR